MEWTAGLSSEFLTVKSWSTAVRDLIEVMHYSEALLTSDLKFSMFHAIDLIFFVVGQFMSSRLVVVVV